MSEICLCLYVLLSLVKHVLLSVGTELEQGIMWEAARILILKHQTRISKEEPQE
jgi:hypothetical protein